MVFYCLPDSFGTRRTDSVPLNLIRICCLVRVLRMNYRRAEKAGKLINKPSKKKKIKSINE